MSDNEEQSKKRGPMFLEGHKPRTRREFLAQGFIGGMAVAMAPTVFELLSSSAMAQSGVCSTGAGVSRTPVIILDLSGGGNLPGSNIIVGGQGGQADFLPSYATMGLPSDMHPSRSGKVNQDLGLMFHSDSGILRGIQNSASMQTRLQMDGAIFCNISNDDTDNNQINPIYWMNKAGARGSLIQLAGTRYSSLSGGLSQSPPLSIDAQYAPVRITNAQEAMNLVHIGDRFNNVAPAHIQSMLQSSARLSKNKIANISRRSFPDAIKNIFGCSIENSANQVKNFNPEIVNPANDPVVQTAMNRITNTDIRSYVTPIAKMVIDGYVGAATIELGGYDYHDSTRATGEIKDYELGQLVGALMELAAMKQKDLVLILLTDGGVSSPEKADNSADGRGKFIWTGDSSDRSSTAMLVYKKDGRPNLRTNKRQVGWFTTYGGVQAAANLTSNSVINLSKALVANYMALHGEEGNLASIVGDNPFGSNLGNYIVFDKLR